MTSIGRAATIDLWQPTPEEELRQLVGNSSFTEVLSASPIGLALVDLHGYVRAANRELVTLLRSVVADPVGEPLRELVHPRDRPRVDDAVVRLLAGARRRSLTGFVHLAAGQSSDAAVRCTASPLIGVSGATFGILIQVQPPADEHAGIRPDLATRDALTGVGTRAWLLAELDRRSSTGLLTGEGLTLALFDVDRMRDLNDLLGHRRGDEVLVEIARRLTTSGRRSDRVARVGPDTFAVLSMSHETAASTTELLARLRRALRAPISVAGETVEVTVSAGAATALPGTRAHELFDTAETALASARRQGPEGMVVLDQAATESNRRRQKILHELRSSLETRSFVLHYQPILSLHEPYAVTSHEALVRWDHGGTLRMPGEFIPVAEDTGLIRDIGVQLIEQAVADLAHRSQLSTVAINISAVQFGDSRWYDAIIESTRSNNVAVDRLVLEVTETAALAITMETRERLLDLRRRGIGLHLDDFGTGYSSVALLRDLPLTGLKLDARFVREVAQGDTAADALSQGLAGLARGLGLHGVAEGVETVEQLTALRSHGWSHVQGYLTGRPQPLTEEDG